MKKNRRLYSLLIVMLIYLVIALNGTCVKAAEESGNSINLQYAVDDSATESSEITPTEQTGERDAGTDIVSGSIKLILILLVVAVVFVVLFGSSHKSYKRK